MKLPRSLASAALLPDLLRNLQHPLHLALSSTKEISGTHRLRGHQSFPRLLGSLTTCPSVSVGNGICHLSVTCSETHPHPHHSRSRCLTCFAQGPSLPTLWRSSGSSSTVYPHPEQSPQGSGPCRMYLVYCCVLSFQPRAGRPGRHPVTTC